MRKMRYEKEREEWNEKSNYAILLELREFECQSFHQFLAWKEKDEDDTFYAQSTGEKPFNDSTNDETGNHFHGLEMHELLLSAMLDTDVKIEIPNRTKCKTDKKVGKVLRNLECNVHIQLPLVGNNGRVKREDKSAYKKGCAWQRWRSKK